MKLDTIQAAQHHLNNGGNVATIGRRLRDAKELASAINNNGTGKLIPVTPRTIRNGALRGYMLAYAITDDHRDLLNPDLIADITPCFRPLGATPAIAVYA